MKLRHFLVVACTTGLVAGATTVAPLAASADSRAPKNVIVMIGDGMGYNHQNNASLYKYGQAYKQVSGTPGNVVEEQGTASFGFQSFPTQVDMTTYWHDGSYDPEQAWSDFEYVKDNPTDSAAAGTAMSTGVKTYNAGLGVDYDGNPVENISERAISMGKSAGSISSVNYWHATPASYVVHHPDRNAILEITNQEILSEMTVIMGAGHPYYDDDNTKLEAPDWESNISQADFQSLEAGEHGWSLVDDKSEFESLTTGDTPDRVFGIAQVSSTLQQGRSGKSVEPYDVPFNEGVPSLATMAKGALNVLDNNEQGFSLMIEGGAIDWAGHANDTARDIEETLEFVDAVDAVTQWVETNSSWDETLLIVTADHETGYLSGPESNPDWTELTGEEGSVPGLSWNHTNHTNQLIPVYAKGAGADALAALATGNDPVRGAYLDNTDLANLLLQDLWMAGDEPSDDPSDDPSQEPSPSLPGKGDRPRPGVPSTGV